MTVRLIFTCTNCKLDFTEPYCDSCGASLMPVLRDENTEPVPGWWAELFEAEKKKEESVSTELVPVVPRELVDIRSGELVEATPAKAAELLVVVREYRDRMMGLVKECEAVLLEESRRQGTKTLHFGSATATVTAGKQLEWDVSALNRLLAVGLPDERFDELVKATVTYKVNARIANQLEAANPEYAKIIGEARNYVETAERVYVK